MTQTRVSSLTVDAHLISFRAGEVLKRFWQDFQELETGDRADVAQGIIARVMQPTDSCQALSEAPNHQGIETNDAQLQTTRYDAPDGPRKRRIDYNREDPLDHPGHEALAQFLATPRLTREFKSFTALAEHLKISRMTIHRWKKDPDVLWRAEWLAKRNKLAGDLVARREWQCIVEAQVAAAKRGNTAAAKFLERRAWPEDQRADSLVSSVSLPEALLESEKIVGRLPSWLRQRSEAARIDPAAGPGDQHDNGESGGTWAGRGIKSEEAK